MKKRSSHHEPEALEGVNLEALYQNRPDSFDRRIDQTLERLSSAEAKRTFHLALPGRSILVCAMLLLLLTTACAAILTHTEQLFSTSYGKNFFENQTLKIGLVGETFQIGDVLFVMDDAVYANETLYLSGEIRPAEGVENVQLLALDEEQYPGTPIGQSGYGNYPGRPESQDGKTWGEYAQENGLRLLGVQMLLDTIMDSEGNNMDEGVFGMAVYQKQNSVEIGLEIPVREHGSYTISLDCGVTPLNAQETAVDFSQRKMECWRVTVDVE